MKKSKKLFKQIIAEIEKMPNKSYVCQKLGLSRQTLYRWVDDDRTFSSEVEIAIRVGNESICDLAESKIIERVKEGDFRAAKYILDNKHKDYRRPRPNNWFQQEHQKPSDNKIVFVDFSGGKDSDPEDDLGFYVG